jgi:hypothetical protein
MVVFKGKAVNIDKINVLQNKISMFLKCATKGCKGGFSFKADVDSDLRDDLKGPVHFTIFEKSVECVCAGKSHKLC